MSLSSTETDDSEAIRRVLSGESQAYGVIIQKYQQRIFAAVLLMVGNREDAEDIAQESLVLGYRNLSSFEGRSSLYTWLHRIAMNLSISHRRKYRREKSIPKTTLEIAEDQMVGREEPVEQTIDRRDEQQMVRTAILRLDEQQKAVLILRDVQGMDYAEIAEALEIPIGTVRSRLHRARLELKSVIELLRSPRLD